MLLLLLLLRLLLLLLLLLPCARAWRVMRGGRFEEHLTAKISGLRLTASTGLLGRPAPASQF